MWNNYWLRSRRDVPQVNESSEDEDNYDSPLVSPQRPPPTRAGSPALLAIPTLGDNVDEELEAVAQTLSNVGHTHTFRNTRPEPEGGEQPVQEVHPLGPEVIDEGFINQEPAGELGEEAPANDIMTNYDMENGEDEAGAIANARDVKLPFNKNDIKLWFSLIESKMQFAGLKAQWSKRQVLVQLIPPEFHSDFKKFLIQQKDEAGRTPYKSLKDAIIKKFGPRKADGFDKAISRVMTGSPSELGHHIVNDICPETNPLTGCHCADVVLGIWRRSLPSVCRNAIADMDFSAGTYTAVFDKADAVWTANAASTPVVAAIGKPNGTAEVAAVQNKKPPRGGRGGANQRGSGRGGNRGNRGGGSGGGRGRGRGPRHADNPPGQACDVHWTHGKSAWFCADRHNCPWRDYESPRPKDNRNIVAETEIID